MPETAVKLIKNSCVDRYEPFGSQRPCMRRPP